MTRRAAPPRWLTAAAVGFVLLLSGCSDPPEHGVVTSKEHHNPWIQMVCSGYNKWGACTVWVPITHPERWELCLRDGDEQGCQTVDEPTYDRYEVGQFYPGDTP